MRDRSPLIASLVAALGIAVVGALDLASGVEYGVFVFYYLPVAFAGWRLGIAGAVATSGASAAAWLAADVLSDPGSGVTIVEMWNTAIRLVAFLATGWAVARLQAALDRERHVSRDLTEALEEVRVLRGLVPVCAWCKRVRDEAGEWQSLETYIQRHTEAEVTHGMCDACAHDQLERAGVSAS